MHWPPDALKLAALPPAASDEHFELHLAAVEHGMAAPILIQSRADVLSAKHWQEQIEPYEHQMRNLITFCRRAPMCGCACAHLSPESQAIGHDAP